MEDRCYLISAEALTDDPDSEGGLSECQYYLNPKNSGHSRQNTYLWGENHFYSDSISEISWMRGQGRKGCCNTYFLAAAGETFSDGIVTLDAPRRG